MTNNIMPTYGRLPVTFTKGQGAWLWDTNGSRYLDALSGIAVCNLGHAHPAIHKAISEQSQRLIHTSNLYHIPEQQMLADKLCELSAMQNVFFCNSGTEANEAAIKIARRYGQEKNIANPRIIVMNNSFHGRTMGSLSATGNPKIHSGFSPLLEGFIHVNFNDIQAIETQLQQSTDIVAILVEPIQGEIGVRIPAPDYLNNIRQLCNQYDILMMLDEVQTGIARTGTWFAFQHNNIIPDVCTLAKALGNGVPIGACMANEKASKLLSAGQHGSTFGGNHLACSAALAVIKTIETEQLCQQAEKQGNKIKDLFTKKLHNNTHIINIRNKGMMIAIELDNNCTELVSLALSSKLLIAVSNENTIRLLPPLIIDDEQITVLINILSSLIEHHTHK